MTESYRVTARPVNGNVTLLMKRFDKEEDAMAYASLLASDNILDNVGHTHISITVEQLFRGEYIEIEVKMVVQ